MKIIKNPTINQLKEAASAMKSGNLVAFPTETVYGIGADASNEKAVSRIYKVKGRPNDHPLIVHISSYNQVEKWARDVPEYAIKLAAEFWPGPMTLILKRSKFAKNFVTGNQENIGLRVPNHLIALTISKESEKLGIEGIAAPSANRFGAVSPTTAEAVEEELGAYLGTNDLIFDGGQSSVGVESTIVSCLEKNPVILRPGAISINMIIATSGLSASYRQKNSSVKVSGSLDSHYSPKAKVILNASPNVGEGFIALADIPTPSGAIRLASPSTTLEFCHLLYETFRRADRMGIKVISVTPPEEGGLGDAINDRLNRAKSKY